MKAAWFQPLVPQLHKLLSNVAVHFNLRPYIKALAKGGWLSDPAATAGKPFPMHIVVGDSLPKSGLQRYRTLRGTSHLEGYHSHLHKATRDAPNHGPVLATALLRDLNHRFSIDSATKNVQGEEYHGCYTPWVLDEINTIYRCYDQPVPYPDVFVNRIGPSSQSSLLSNFTSSNVQGMYDDYLLDREAVANELIHDAEVRRGEDSILDELTQADEECFSEMSTEDFERRVFEVGRRSREPEEDTSVLDTVPSQSSPCHMAQISSGPSARTATRDAAALERTSPSDQTSLPATVGRPRQMTSTATMQSLNPDGVPDIPRPVKTTEEMALFAKMCPEYCVANGDGIPNFITMVHDWNVAHVFPTIVVEPFTNARSVPGPIFVKDVHSLKFYFERSYNTQKVRDTAINSMVGGQAGYHAAMSAAHTSKANTTQAAHKVFSAPSAEQPTPSLPPATDTAAMRLVFQQQVQIPVAHAAPATVRSTCQMGVKKRCRNCLSRKGKQYDHPSGKSTKLCTYETNRFKDDPEGLLNFDT